jgi:hypothetical protein
MCFQYQEIETMAIFHMSAQTITRSKGHSSVAAAAYRHGEKLTDEHTGEIHDYSKKKGISDSVILIPESADRNFLKPAYLWNTIEKSEKRKDAQLAREFNIALPVEMTDEQKTPERKRIRPHDSVLKPHRKPGYRGSHVFAQRLRLP